MPTILANTVPVRNFKSSANTAEILTMYCNKGHVCLADICRLDVQIWHVMCSKTDQSINQSINQYRNLLHRDVASTVQVITVHKIQKGWWVPAEPSIQCCIETTKSNYLIVPAGKFKSSTITADIFSANIIQMIYHKQNKELFQDKNWRNQIKVAAIPRWYIRDIQVIAVRQIFHARVAGLRHARQRAHRHMASALQELTDVGAVSWRCRDT